MTCGAKWATCPEPWPDCRPGACACDMAYDRAAHRGQDPCKARHEYIAKARRVEVHTCEACNGQGYTDNWEALTKEES